jgi:TRAP-type C4-dicarboxylate transport system permease small subunit
MGVIYLTVPVGFLFGTIEYTRAFIKNIKNKDEVFISSSLRLGENMDDVGTDEKEEEK